MVINDSLDIAKRFHFLKVSTSFIKSVDRIKVSNKVSEDFLVSTLRNFPQLERLVSKVV
jgi:hypothetical protein